LRLLNAKLHPLARLDRQYVWHPFTQMQDWLKREPIVLVRGKGRRGLRSLLSPEDHCVTDLQAYCGNQQIGLPLDFYECRLLDDLLTGRVRVPETVE
jgi:hypothetical protein